MKKYLLTALLGVFGLCTAFVSADTFTYTDDSYSPSSLTINDSLTLSSSSISDFSCSSACELVIGEPYVNGTCTIYYYDDNFEFEYTVENGNTVGSCPMSAGTYDLSYYENPFSSISINLSSSSGGDSDSSPLLPGGSTAFSGIISSLGSAVSEFIPYVAYIGIGLLGAIIGFVAIKRLINRVRAKIFGTFSGGRRR